MAQLLVIDEHVQHMLEHDVIERAASPWCSNVVMVRKQDGTMQLCVNYCKLNGLTTKDKFPLLKIDICLDTLNGCKFFSTCDLRWDCLGVAVGGTGPIAQAAAGGDGAPAVLASPPRHQGANRQQPKNEFPPRRCGLCAIDCIFVTRNSFNMVGLANVPSQFA